MGPRAALGTNPEPAAVHPRAGPGEGGGRARARRLQQNDDGIREYQTVLAAPPTLWGGHASPSPCCARSASATRYPPPSGGVLPPCNGPRRADFGLKLPPGFRRLHRDIVGEEDHGGF
ncbi:hypothetical protein GGTG_07214 [Gaeumannomyces tritici R3-111a-1]|uniref:Uncharacterized protein n=1 Tax=Gaeumannomyces tritici (strain R3-111a-1) TaxID=644352 RepID=J3P117_GAET3|nr:hypothetical protein GGTG_07214 [Gaeumannomyces tritici R3-111a-1]EJT77302.1 hypothetical protein GGTG_07214 [Gaeumannomyces tritici R3-111a-1]